MGSMSSGVWAVYIVFGFIFFPTLFYLQNKERIKLEETLENAKQYTDINVMEGGGYALYNEKKKPTPKTLIGAAACGYNHSYEYAYR